MPQSFLVLLGWMVHSVAQTLHTVNWTDRPLLQTFSSLCGPCLQKGLATLVPELEAPKSLLPPPASVPPICFVTQPVSRVYWVALRSPCFPAAVAQCRQGPLSPLTCLSCCRASLCPGPSSSSTEPPHVLTSVQVSLCFSFYLGCLSHPLVSSSSFPATCRPALISPAFLGSPAPITLTLPIGLVISATRLWASWVSQSTTGPLAALEDQFPSCHFSDSGRVTPG